ncbi:hypothetical protein SOJ12_05070, partial [Treponema pallidum subsp. pallidum]
MRVRHTKPARAAGVAAHRSFSLCNEAVYRRGQKVFPLVLRRAARFLHECLPARCEVFEHARSEAKKVHRRYFLPGECAGRACRVWRAVFRALCGNDPSAAVRVPADVRVFVYGTHQASCGGDCGGGGRDCGVSVRKGADTARNA